MQEKIINLITQALGIETTDIKETSQLREDLGLSDTDLIEIISKINTDYKVEIPEERIVEAITVEDLVELAENYVQEEI